LLLKLDREPVPLYRMLESSGHAWQTRRSADGGFDVLIWRQSN